MTVDEIIQLCQQQVEEVYDTPTWISLINAALDDLTPVSLFLKTKTGIAVTLVGGKAIVPLADGVSSPTNLTVTPTGGTSTTWGYRVSAITDSGESLACAEVKTTAGAASLTGPTACNTLTWDAVAGATGYKVYRTTAEGTPNTTGLMATVTDEKYIDGGASADGSPVPSVDSSGDLAKAHEIRSVYFLPAGTGRRQLRRLPVENYSTEGWKLDSGNIILQNLGTAQTGDAIDVDYYKKIAHVVSGADIPDIPTEYHNLIVLYACAKSQQKEEELNDKTDLFNEYMMKKNEYALNRMWNMEPQNRKYIKRARIAALLGSAAPTS